MKKERAVKDHKELYDKSIKPLMTILFIKLGRFDKFFRQISITVHDEIIENSLEKFLKIFNAKLYHDYDLLPVTFTYKDFINQNGKKKMKIVFKINFGFHTKEYTVSVIAKDQIRYTNPYDVPLSSEQINSISDMLTDFVYTTIEAELKKNR
ncbi:MAG: hypothetical protein KJ607_14365 [Bacteroidetes bacterium]|nr:hypothetical protein [Bacteroidota bacterium]